MNDKGSIVYNITCLDDLRKMDKKTVYLSIDINHPNREIINYLKENGHNYYYTEATNNNGFIYTDYEIFIKGQQIIEGIIDGINNNFNKLATAKYLYITLGKMVSYDINTLVEKNAEVTFDMISGINNIWSAISLGRITNCSLCKLYSYLCSLADIDNDIINTSDEQYQVVRLKIDGNNFVVDLTQDLPYIQSRFKTRYFGTYNDDKELDQKIRYITNTYQEEGLNIALRKINLSDQQVVAAVLDVSKNFIDTTLLHPIELGLIYEKILNQYCPSRQIIINNLYMSNIYTGQKEHFILISDNSKHYSFNYQQNSFISVSKEELETALETNRVSRYLNELIPGIN